MVAYYVMCLQLLVLVLGLDLLQVVHGRTTTTVALPADVYCYTCKSWEEERCNDPYNLESLTPNWCGSRVCYKTVIEDAPEGIPEGVERGCAPEPSPERCDSSYRGTNGASGTMCYCTGDRCNAAPASLPVTHKATIVGTVLLAVVVKLLTIL